MPTIRLPLVLPLVAFVAGCGSSTKLSGVWHDEDARERGAIRSVLVVGVTDDQARRRFFEREIARQFEGSGVVATPSSTVFAPGADPGAAGIRAACAERGIDAVLVTSVLSIDTTTERVPERTTVEVDSNPQYTTFSSYYKETKEIVTEPGYSYERTTVRLETHVYDVATEAAIWSARSETRDPGSIDEIVDDLGRAVLKSLTDLGLIAR